MGLGIPKTTSGVFGSVTQTIIMDCEISAVVDDLVRQDQTVDNKVEVSINNQEKFPIIGIISKKLTDTTCEVILRGVIDVAIATAGRVYLSSIGGFTTNTAIAKPYYLQMLGYSFGNGKLHFEPNAIITLQV